MFLITGSSGFLGNAVLSELLAANYRVVSVVRQLSSQGLLEHKNLRWHSVGNIDRETKWLDALRDVTVVVHCAGLAHLTGKRLFGAFADYREVNVLGTLQLAQQAAAAGVLRFVFISSIGVNGSESTAAFTESSPPNPYDAYTLSKSEAEEALLAIAAQTGMEVVIIRPPLVYGPGAPGNFASLVRWVQCGLPLPFGALHNQRSLVALDNLVSLVLLCADRTRSPKAANHVFLVADGEDVSTTTLLRKVAQAAGRPSRLLPVPAWLLRTIANLLGRRIIADRLLSNLQIDSAKARSLLRWQPVVTMDQQLAKIFATRAAVSYFSPLFRVLDVLLAGVGLLVLWPVLLLVFVIGWFDTRSPMFTQERVGRHQRPFVLVKFRTMYPGTKNVASHLASSSSITRLGKLLRRTKLDELPQLWNVLLGHMSLVGPRPCLYNQHKLIQARDAQGVFAARPGITGLAQVNGIDMSTPDLLAQTDARMLRELNLINYFKFIFLTMAGKGSRDGVKAK